MSTLTLGFRPTWTPSTQRRPSGATTLCLLAAAPFIGLAFIVLLPIGGLAMLGLHAVEAAFASGRLLAALERIGLGVAAPFIGLAFIALLPVVGLATLATLAVTTAPRTTGVAH